MIRRTSYVSTKYDKRRSLERRASVQESLDAALGIGFDDEIPLFVIQYDVRTNSVSPPSPRREGSQVPKPKKITQRRRSLNATVEKKRKCPPRRVSSADSAGSARPSETIRMSDSTETTSATISEHNKKQLRKQRKSKKLKKKSAKLNDDSTVLTVPTTQEVTDAKNTTRSKGNTSPSSRSSRKPRKKSDLTIISLAAKVTSENCPRSKERTSPSGRRSKSAVKETTSPSGLRGKPAFKKRNSFFVPTNSPLHESICIDELHLPDPNLRRGSSVMFSDFSEMTFVAALSEGNNGDLFYNDEELAEFRHEAFLESCGLGEEYKHL
ncbi:unnamed protein product [Cylindrotheca closterium]|uniref:Uncharacterized protein n=1 Tax=Cylindrotheca closterium TaxID=2856 RepID=A0AAD2FHI2_9STRA|nr:unnamed protein product [Cylindrotheca closterium]